MNLTESQEADILKYHRRGLSQNAISKELNIPKPYVSAIINTSRRTDRLAGFDQPNLFANPNTGLPVTQKLEVLNPHSGNSSAEMYYTKKSLQDAEDRVRDLKNELAQKIMDYETLRKEHNLLLIDHRTVQEKHNLELERKDLNHQSQQKSGLNGLAETLTAPILKNEKLLEKLVSIAAAKYLGPSEGQPAENSQISGVAHPQINDPEVKSMLSDIAGCLHMFDKERLTQLHGLISIFLSEKFPDMLPVTFNQVTGHIREITNQPQQ